MVAKRAGGLAQHMHRVSRSGAIRFVLSYSNQGKSSETDLPF